MAVTSDKPAPYAPSKTILDLIDRHRQKGLSIPVNADVLMRAGIPESLISRTLQALQTLDLIDKDGKPTPTFEGIRLAPETEYKKRLEDWLKGTYADVFTFVDPSTDDETRVRDAFRTYNPVAQQPPMGSAVSGTCAAAGSPTNRRCSPSDVLSSDHAPSHQQKGDRAASPLKRTPKRPRREALKPSRQLRTLADWPVCQPTVMAGPGRRDISNDVHRRLDYCIPIEDEAEKERRQSRGGPPLSIRLASGRVHRCSRQPP